MKDMKYKLISWLNKYTQNILDKREELRFKNFNVLRDINYNCKIDKSVLTDTLIDKGKGVGLQTFIMKKNVSQLVNNKY